ncbi:MAG: aldehyde dehydrogenase family protein [Pseudomonadota bacterium]
MTAECVNCDGIPSDASDGVEVYRQACVADVDDAVAAASAAFPAWSRTMPQERGDLLGRVAQELFARQDELGQLLAPEQGKTLCATVGEVVCAAQVFDFFAAESVRIHGDLPAPLYPDADVEVTREARGVIGVIAPCNFPMGMPAWKIAAALAFGNCIVFKPAELAPAPVFVLARILAAAGLPAGVLNLVMGEGSAASQRMLEHRDIVAIDGLDRRRPRRRRFHVDGQTYAAHPLLLVRVLHAGKMRLQHPTHVEMDDAGMAAGSGTEEQPAGPMEPVPAW